jgi:hypothetical protein
MIRKDSPKSSARSHKRQIERGRVVSGDVRMAPKAPELLHRNEMARWANTDQSAARQETQNS